MQEGIITSIPKLMNFNFTGENLGDIKINSGNVQKCHPKYD